MGITTIISILFISNIFFLYKKNSVVMNNIKNYSLKSFSNKSNNNKYTFSNDNQQYIFNLLSKISTNRSVTIIDIPEKISKQINNNTISLSKFSISGSYIQLVKLLSDVNNGELCDVLISSNFKKTTNFKTKRSLLILELSFQHVEESNSHAEYNEKTN